MSTDWGQGWGPALRLGTGARTGCLWRRRAARAVDSSGTQALGGASSTPAISRDGRYVAFGSTASNLVAGDTNGARDVFVHDRQTGATTRVSVDSGGTEGNASSAAVAPSVSDDGRYVAFQSEASNLVAGDTNTFSDIFVHDRQTGATARVSVDSGGTEANGLSGHLGRGPSISGDGRYVAFTSAATNLVAGDTNAQEDIFVHDRQTGATTRASVDSSGTQGNSLSVSASISQDGRFVAFYSGASNLVPGDTVFIDVFVHDRQSGATTRVSLDSAGNEGSGSNIIVVLFGNSPVMSDDNRHVAFATSDSQLVTGDGNGAYDIFARDRTASTTDRISVDSNGTEGDSSSHQPTIDSNGRFIAFWSSATNLVAADTNGVADVFVRDRLDFDGDGIIDAADVCGGTTPSADVDSNGCSQAQVDADGDGVCDPGAPSGGPSACTGSDNCPSTPNPGQENSVHPGTTAGDHCEDPEPDGVFDITDNCPDVVNPLQENNVHPGTAAGDHCEDPEPDGVFDIADNCPDTANPGQENNVHAGTDEGDHCEDPDADTVFDINDNCPDTPNPGQENGDTDGLGDACDRDDDNDGYWDDDETGKGSNTLDANSTPEHCDGVDNDGDTTVDEAPAGSGRATPDPLCDPAADPDGDTIPNSADLDDDGDGHSDADEQFLSTDELDDCSNNTAHDALATDFDKNTKTNIIDVLFFGPVILAFAGEPRYARRFDVDANGNINIIDVLFFGPVILTDCDAL